MIVEIKRYFYAYTAYDSQRNMVSVGSYITEITEELAVEELHSHIVNLALEAELEADNDYEIAFIHITALNAV